MYPYAPPAAEPAPNAGANHVTVNAVLMCVLAPLHLAGLASALMNITRFFHDHPSYAGSPFERGELVGQMIAYVGALLWSVSGLVWAPLDAYGLFTRAPWSRTSSMIHWVVQLLSCCCFPFGAYGPWSMCRGDVRSIFQR